MRQENKQIMSALFRFRDKEKNMNFSKSKYCDFCQCGKLSWLKKNKPDEAVKDDGAQARFEAGKVVGELAKGYFGDFVDVTEKKEDGNPDLSKMIENTKAEMEKKTPVICEAAFSSGGLYCAVDILRREGDGWSIYEVKSSGYDYKTNKIKDVYLLDVAYQKYVLGLCGINVTGTYLMQIDKKYIFDGTLDIHKFFKVTDVAEMIAEKVPEVEGNLKRAEEILAEENEPDIKMGGQCFKPYDCAFWNYCTRNIPKPNVFDLHKPSSRKGMVDLYYRGIATFEDLENKYEKLTPIQKMQIDHYLHDRGTYVDKEKLRGFLSGLSYPLYFLDFESFQPAVPRYAGTRPYMQIPFQYSLHYIESEGGELKHKEFLAKEGSDPLRPIAEALCRDIPKDVTVLVYNETFEKSRLEDLSKMFPDLAEHLKNINSHINDLVVPFREGMYFNRGMCTKGSAGSIFSIKNVLPAVFPDDPSLDYHNLEGVHNGGEAMNAFPAMENMSPEELAEARKNLLKYCELDTLAMVRLLEALRQAASKD